jgi:hypothetical protein
MLFLIIAAIVMVVLSILASMESGREHHDPRL